MNRIMVTNQIFPSPSSTFLGVLGLPGSVCGIILALVPFNIIGKSHLSRFLHDNHISQQSKIDAFTNVFV